jgi:hypothetical protein
MHAKFYSIKLFCAFIEHSIRFGKKLAPTGPECTKFSSKASLDESNLSSSIVFSPDLLQTTPRPCPSNPHLHALLNAPATRTPSYDRRTRGTPTDTLMRAPKRVRANKRPPRLVAWEYELCRTHPSVTCGLQMPGHWPKFGKTRDDIWVVEGRSHNGRSLLLGCGDHGELPPTSPGLVRLFLGGEGIVIGLLSYLPFLRSKLFYSSAKIREKKPLVMLQWTELVMTCTVLPSRQYLAETGYCTNQ